MEARVDLRKLQLLNERIAQCIDAVDQVRMSVHGLSTPPAQSVGWAGQPVGAYGPQLRPIHLNPFFGAVPTPYGLQPNPYAQPYPFHPQQQPFFPAGLTQPYDPVEQRVLDARINDPARIAQTFPYAFSPQSPLTYGPQVAPMAWGNTVSPFGNW